MSYTNNTHIPLSIAVWLASDNYQGKPLADKAISVTTLLKSVRQIVLGYRAATLTGTAAQTQQVDILSRFKSRKGTALHTAIEQAWLSPNLPEYLLRLGVANSVVNRVRINPETIEPNAINVYMERRTDKVINGWNITGAFDFVMDGQIQDFKYTTVYSYTKSKNDLKYIQQASMYRWLNPEIITKPTMAISFIFHDWNQFKLGTDNYPVNPILPRTYNLMPIDQTEYFIIDKLSEIEAAWNLPETELPLCSDEDLWKDDPDYKYYKSGVVSARSTKNFTNLHDAQKRLYDDGGTGIIVPSKVKAKACAYCAAASICSQRLNEITE